MKLTGKQLIELQGICLNEANKHYLTTDNGSLSEIFWDIMAEKLNGMMAGEAVDETTTGGPTRAAYGDPRIIGLLDRARHHATCPYRHGKGDCTC